MPKPHKIERLYAWVATYANGEERIPAAVVSPGLALPLVGGDRARIEGMAAHAMDAALNPEVVSVRFVCFDHLVEIEKLR